MPRDVDCVVAGERLHSFDAIRAGALLLGVVLHAGESFIPDNRTWAIVDDSTSPVAGAMVYVIHIFRMPAFFLMAGFFGRMALQRRGPAGFVRDRAKRVLVPLVLGWCLLYPLIVWAWIWGAQRSGGGLLGEAAREPAWQVAFSALATGDVFRGGVQLSHLWFLYYLLMCYAAVLAVRQGLVVRFDRGMGLRGRIDRAFAAVWRARWSFVILALPVFGSLCLAPGWVGVDTPDQTLRPNPPYLLAYATFFAVGWLLHRQPHLVDTLVRRQRSCSGWVALLSVPLVVFVLRHGREPSGPWVRIPYVAAYAVAMWAWVLGLLGLGARWFSRSRPAVRYVSESSYWLYLMHLPLVLFLQVSMAHVPWPWSLKLATVLVVVLSVLLVSYHACVRFTAIGLLLNGRRRERAGRTAQAEALAARA
jgi:peptidoglycan/LPS O-acetylase OafA/YrhL